MGYYQYHVFVCENQRANGDSCYCRSQATLTQDAISLMRGWLLEKNTHGVGQVRINRAGCFNRCKQGPILVVYPDNVWYRYSSERDLYIIIHEHLLGGRIVQFLRLDDSA